MKRITGRALFKGWVQYLLVRSCACLCVRACRACACQCVPVRACLCVRATCACACYLCLCVLPVPVRATCACACYLCLCVLPVPVRATCACACYLCLCVRACACVPVRAWCVPVRACLCVRSCACVPVRACLCARACACVPVRASVPPLPAYPAHAVGRNSRIASASVPASNCTTYPWEELPLKKCPNGDQPHIIARRLCTYMLLEGEELWAIVVRRGLYKSLFLPNSDHLSLDNKGNSVLNLVRLSTSKSLWPKFFPL